MGQDLNDLGVCFEVPIQDAHPFVKQTLFLIDPAGYHYAAYIPRTSSSVSPARGRMTAVGYLEREGPDMDASIDFYEKVLWDLH